MLYRFGTAMDYKNNKIKYNTRKEYGVGRPIMYELIQANVNNLYRNYKEIVKKKHRDYYHYFKDTVSLKEIMD